MVEEGSEKTAHRTAGIAAAGEILVGTTRMGDAVVVAL